MCECAPILSILVRSLISVVPNDTSPVDVILLVLTVYNYV